MDLFLSELYDIYENQLSLKGTKSEIRRFVLNHIGELECLTLYGTSNGYGENELWLTGNNHKSFLSDAFEVEFDDTDNIYYFLTICLIPTKWVKGVALKYPTIEFTYIHGDPRNNKSEILSVLNDVILCEKRGDYCSYWKPKCELCGMRNARRYNESLCEYYCYDCAFVFKNNYEMI